MNSIKYRNRGMELSQDKQKLDFKFAKIRSNIDTSNGHVVILG